MQISRRKFLRLAEAGSALVISEILSPKKLEGKTNTNLANNSQLEADKVIPSGGLGKDELFWRGWNTTMNDAISSNFSAFVAGILEIRKCENRAKNNAEMRDIEEAKIKRINADLIATPINWFQITLFRTLLKYYGVEAKHGSLTCDLIAFHLQTALLRSKNTLTQWLIDCDSDPKKVPWLKLPGEILSSTYGTLRDVIWEIRSKPLPAWWAGLGLNALGFATAYSGYHASFSKGLATFPRQFIVGADQIEKAVNSFLKAVPDINDTDKRIIVRDIYCRSLNEEEKLRLTTLKECEIESTTPYNELIGAINKAQANCLVYPTKYFLEAFFVPPIEEICKEPNLTREANLNKAQAWASLAQTISFIVFKPLLQDSLEITFKESQNSITSRIFLELMIPAEYKNFLL